jgi:hypothetical protein
MIHKTSNKSCWQVACFILFFFACASPPKDYPLTSLNPINPKEPTSISPKTNATQTQPGAVLAPSEQSELEELPGLVLSEIESISPTLFMKNATLASVAKDGKTMAVFRYKEAVLISSSGRASFPGEFDSARFSPDLSLVILIAWRRACLVSMKDGKLLQEFKSYDEKSPTELEARFLSNGELLFFDGCQLQQINIKTKKTSTIGTKICGRAASNEEGTRWIFSETNAEIYTSRQAFGLYYFELGTKEIKTILKNKTVSLITVSPTADRVCYSESAVGMHGPKGYLCWEQSGRITKVWDGIVSKSFGFSPDGWRGVLGTGDYDNPNAIYLIDFKAQTRQKITDLSTSHEWFDMISSERVIATGASDPALFIDLSKLSVLAPPPAEWEGFVGIPGNDKKAIVGRERGGSRDLYSVSWP